MRVLHVLAPARFGGLEQVVCDLTRALTLAGADVHVAPILTESTCGLHPFLQALQDGSVCLHPIRVGRRAYLQERAQVQWLCRQLAPDVVHTHGYHADVVAGRAARSLGIPTIATAHGFTGGGWRNRCYEMLQRIAFRDCAAVIAVSKPLASQLARKSRVEMIRNAWPGDRIFLTPAQARQRLGIHGVRAQIGWIGRLSPEKGPDIMVEAMTELPDCDLTIIGDGALRGTLEQRVADLGIGARVRFTGIIEHAAELLPAFDVFALTSRTEGTPISLFEAIAAGVPVVAARVGGVPDVVDDHAALLVSPGNAHVVATGVKRAIREPAACLQRASVARNRVAALFSMDEWISKHLELYHRVTSKIEAA